MSSTEYRNLFYLNKSELLTMWLIDGIIQAMTRYTYLILLISISLLAACAAPPSDTAIKVVLVADGQRTELDTEAITVREVLEQARVTLGELDRVRPPETFAISNGAVITVTRISQSFETETKVVPYEQQIARDAAHSRASIKA